MLHVIILNSNTFSNFKYIGDILKCKNVIRVSISTVMATNRINHTFICKIKHPDVSGATLKLKCQLLA